MTEQTYDSALRRLAVERGQEVCCVVVGGMDGVSFDTVLHPYIVNLHWKVLFIEPLLEFCELIRQNYGAQKSILVENCAISEPGRGQDE